MYLSIFLDAANSATELASRAAEATYESAKGHTTVTSQTQPASLVEEVKQVIIIIIIFIIINV